MADQTQGPVDPRYEEIANAFLEYLSRLNGHELTLNKASKVPGLIVSPYLTVRITKDPQETIMNMIKEFEDLSGAMALTYFSEATRDLLNKYTDLPLPPELRYT